MKKTVWTLAVALAVPMAGCKKESKPADAEKPAAAAQPQQVDTAALEKAAEKWVDEDEQNGAPVEDDFDMDDMAGMGGLPGMGGGLGGMGGGLGGLGGGLGGMGGGGMDFEKVSIVAECWRC